MHRFGKLSLPTVEQTWKWSTFKFSLQHNYLLAGVKVSFSPKLYRIIEIVEKIMVDTYCYSDENRQFKPNTAI